MARDLLLETAVTPDLVADGLEFDAYHLGLSAYLWGYPLVRMERVCRQYTSVEDPRPATSYRAPLNRIGWARQLAGPSSKDMPTANADTLYLSAVVDLSAPYVLTVPDTADRYYVINVFSMYQELEHYIGRRTTGTGPGRFLLVPPGWAGPVADGATRLEVTTPKAWLWGRLRVSPDEDLAKVHALQDGFTLQPLDQDASPAPAALPPLPDTGDDELGFFTELGAAMGRNPVYPVDEALVAQYSRIGLTTSGFDPTGLTDRQRAALARALEHGPAAAQAAFTSGSENRGGWVWATGMDSFGLDYPRRTVIAGPYLGGNGEHEAMYPGGFTDSEGRPLTGQHSYRIVFDSPPPVDAFWSLTLYRASDKMLTGNKLNRYKIGSDTPGLTTSPNGRLEIRVQHPEPDPGDEVNWLPAPTEPFYVILRLYQPTQAVLDGTWPLPAIQRID